MTNDSHDPFSAPSALPPLAGQQPGSLPSLAGAGGNSLAQAARLKQLKTARNILIGLGIVLVLFSLPFTIGADGLAKSIIDDEVKELARNGMRPDPIKLAQVTESLGRSIRLGGLFMFGIGALYFVLAALVRRKPVPATITALVVYLGSNIIGIVQSGDPKQLLSMWWLKLIIIVALVKAVQAAIAYQNAEKEFQQSSAELAG